MIILFPSLFSSSILSKNELKKHWHIFAVLYFRTNPIRSY
ncbi:hypothetical protein HMPREF1232_2168 [Streptococcus pyogenes GA40468]|nr:hypothetical protein HMPREF1232_2168 [Streptococcus pyogenes GA40468]